MGSMLSVDEVKDYLDIEHAELEGLLEKGRLHAYKIGGTYIRFRKEEVESLRYQIKRSEVKKPAKRNFFSHVTDFWRFNNFYIVSLLLVVAAIAWLIKTQ